MRSVARIVQPRMLLAVVIQLGVHCEVMVRVTGVFMCVIGCGVVVVAMMIMSTVMMPAVSAVCT